MKKIAKDERIIASILQRYQEQTSKTGMARGFLVIDENVSYLEKPLEQANFHVLVPTAGLEDSEIKKTLLGNRVLVTKNTKDFLDDAPVYDYGIIGLEALPFIDSEKTYADNKTAKMISQAYSHFNLHSKKHGFVLMLRENGKHVLRDLE